MRSDYVPRESANKYGLSILKDVLEHEEPKMKIDVEIEKLHQRSESYKKMFAAKLKQEAARKKKSSSLLLDQHTTNVLEAIQDDKAIPASPDNDVDGIDVDDILIHEEAIDVDEDADIDIPTQQTTLMGIETTSMSFDIDALIDDMDEIDDLTRGTTQKNFSKDDIVIIDQVDDKKTEEAEEQQTEHVKDTAGTEIINLDVVEPRKSKVVLIQDKDIKDEQLQDGAEDSLNLESMNIDDLIGDVMDSMNEEEEEEHKASDTVVLTQDIKSSSVDVE
eukprot:UN04949